MKLTRLKRSFNYFRYIPLGLIVIYQKAITPFFPPSCRFYPSCSSYAQLAIQKYGVFRGGFMAIIRILKCNPWNPGGYDPVD